MQTCSSLLLVTQPNCGSYPKALIFSGMPCPGVPGVWGLPSTGKVLGHIELGSAGGHKCKVEITLLHTHPHTHLNLSAQGKGTWPCFPCSHCHPFSQGAAQLRGTWPVPQHWAHCGSAWLCPPLLWKSCLNQRPLPKKSPLHRIVELLNHQGCKSSPSLTISLTYQFPPLGHVPQRYLHTFLKYLQGW